MYCIIRSEYSLGNMKGTYYCLLLVLLIDLVSGILKEKYIEFGSFKIGLRLVHEQLIVVANADPNADPEPQRKRRRCGKRGCSSKRRRSNKVRIRTVERIRPARRTRSRNGHKRTRSCQIKGTCSQTRVKSCHSKGTCFKQRVRDWDCSNKEACYRRREECCQNHLSCCTTPCCPIQTIPVVTPPQIITTTSGMFHQRSFFTLQTKIIFIDPIISSYTINIHFFALQYQ